MLPVLPALEHDQPDKFSRASLLVENIFGQILRSTNSEVSLNTETNGADLSVHIIEEEIVCEILVSLGPNEFSVM